MSRAPGNASGGAQLGQRLPVTGVRGRHGVVVVAADREDRLQIAERLGDPGDVRAPVLLRHDRVRRPRGTPRARQVVVPQHADHQAKPVLLVGDPGELARGGEEPVVEPGEIVVPRRVEGERLARRRPLVPVVQDRQHRDQHAGEALPAPGRQVHPPFVLARVGEAAPRRIYDQRNKRTADDEMRARRVDGERLHVVTTPSPRWLNRFTCRPAKAIVDPLRDQG
jgi:hypothetical protein